MMLGTRAFRSVLCIGLGWGYFVEKSLGQTCDPGVQNSWSGLGDAVHWAIPGNWNPLFGAPNGDDHVIFDFPATTIMDLDDTFAWGRRICSMTVIQTGDGGVDLSQEVQTSRQLYIERDLERAAAVGDFTFKLGAADAVFVGNPSAVLYGGTGTAVGSTRGYCWDIDGQLGALEPPSYALLSVTDTLGCGSLTARDARIGIGYNPLGPEGNPDTFSIIPDGDGTIDSLWCGGFSGPEVPCTNNSPWMLNSVSLRAKKCVNLGQWTVTETGEYPALIYIKDYFRSNLMTFDTSRSGRFFVGFTGEDPYNPLPEEGLRVGNNSLSFGGPPGFPKLKGPTVIAEKLRVETGTHLAISDGVDFWVSHWSEPAFGEPEHSNVHLPVEAVFLGDSSLRYGPRSGNTDEGCDPFDCVVPYEDCFPCQPITNFEVRDRTAKPRSPALQFKEQSYITTLDPQNPGPDDEMELRLQTHLDVESIVSEPPANQWNTGNVDLALFQFTQDDPIYCEAQGLTGNCNIELEVFSPDSCNVWFIDLIEPRRQKYWRSLRAAPLGPADEFHAKLVDRHDNYRPELPNTDPCNTDLFPEALYVAGDVGVADPSQPWLHVDLNDRRLYYGGSLAPEPYIFLSDSTGGGPEYAKLIMTRWGDFNGDCIINSSDEALFPLAGDWSNFPIPTRPAHIPLYDFDGDGLVDSTDYVEFYNRLVDPQYDSIEDCTGGTEGDPLAVWCASGPPTWPAFSPPCLCERGRTISMSSDQDVDEPVALKVFAGPNNPAAACLPLYVQSDGTLGVEAVTMLPEDWNNLLIADSEVVPDAVYELKVEYGTYLSPASTVTTSLWGDSDGSGVVDVDDILCSLAAFGGGSYGNCSLRSADWVGDLDFCTPNGLLDVDDLLAALDAFAGHPYSVWCDASPCTGGSTGGTTGSGITLLLTASKYTMNPGQTTTVHVFVRGPQDLRAYQAGISVTGIGTSTLIPQPLVVDTQRTDFVFLGTSAVSAIDNPQGRLTSARYSGGTNVGNSRKYLGSFPLKASATGTGTFTISVNGSLSQLKDSNRDKLNWTAPSTITINVVDPL